MIDVAEGRLNDPAINDFYVESFYEIDNCFKVQQETRYTSSNKGEILKISNMNDIKSQDGTPDI